jgi:hypothetical protein
MMTEEKVKLTEEEIKSCDNCNKVHERLYSNGGKLCFGVVNVPFRACDFIRSCRTYDNGKTFLEDVAVDEAAEALAGYAAALNSVIGFTYNRPCSECDKEETGCTSK